MCSIGFIIVSSLQGVAAGGDATPRRVWDICAGYTPLVEPAEEAFEQAFVDLTGSRATPCLIHALAQERGGASLASGWASSKFVARAAAMSMAGIGAGTRVGGGIGGGIGVGIARSAAGSITEVPRGREAEFLAPLDVSLLWHVPPELVDKLRRLGLNRMGLVRQVPLDELRLQLGDYAIRIYSLCNGVDGEPVRATYPPPVMRASRCFQFELGPGTEIMAEREIAAALESLVAEAGREPEVRDGRRALVSVSLTLIPNGARLERATKQASLSYDPLHLMVMGLWRAAAGAVARTSREGQRAGSIQGFELELKFAEGAEAASALSGTQEPMFRRQDGHLRDPVEPRRPRDLVDPRLARTLSGLVLRFGSGTVSTGVGQEAGPALRSAAGDPQVARRELARAALGQRSLGDEMSTA